MTPTIGQSSSRPDRLALPRLQLQSSVLAHVLEELTGASRLTPQARTWIASDPALMAYLLDETRAPASRATLDSFFEGLDCEDFKLNLTTLAIECLGLGQPLSGFPGQWDTSLFCAHLCMGLALESGYPVDEAYLAGLFHNLDQFIVPASSFSASSAFTRTAGWLENLRSWGNMAAAIEAQRESDERLRDALPLPKLLRLARAIANGEENTYALAARILPQLSADTIEGTRTQAVKAVQKTKQSLGLFINDPFPSRPVRPALSQLASALETFALGEKAIGMLSQMTTPTQAIGIAQNFMESHLQAHHLLYLQFDKGANTLSPQSEKAAEFSGLSISVKESNSAAAWAMSNRMPVLFSTHDPDSISLIDLQFARQCGYGHVLALPIGEYEIEGVMLGCVDARQAAFLEENTNFLGQLGRFIGRSLREQPKHRRPDPNPAQEDGNGLRTRIRSVVHEIQNPLGIVKNYLALLRSKLGEDNPALDEIRVINEELNRIPAILERLHNSALETGRKTESIDVNNVLQDMAIIAESAMPEEKRIQIRIVSEPGLPTVKTDVAALKQLLLNLILNALDATPDGGAITLESYRSVDIGQHIRVAIAIRDTGPGIPDERLSRLFEPTGTTKGERHAGLGLSIVKSLATDLGIALSCQSNANGTVFRLFFEDSA